MLAHGWSILLVIHPCPTTEQGKESPPASSQLDFNTVRDISGAVVDIDYDWFEDADLLLSGVGGHVMIGAILRHRDRP